MAEMKVATEGRCCDCDCCCGAEEEEVGGAASATLLLFWVAQHGVVFS